MHDDELTALRALLEGHHRDAERLCESLSVYRRAELIRCAGELRDIAQRIDREHMSDTSQSLRLTGGA